MKYASSIFKAAATAASPAERETEYTTSFVTAPCLGLRAGPVGMAVPSAFKSHNVTFALFLIGSMRVPVVGLGKTTWKV